MLNPNLIPTPLVQRGEAAPIQIEKRPPRARFRIGFLFFNLLALLAHVCWLRLLRRLTEEQLGNLLRDFCQRMGVLWIKVGQLLSMRADLAPPGVRAPLARLFDRVQGFPGETAVRLIEKDLGLPLESCFSDFEREPLAAASIGQVHKARLRKEGVWVAVKVRRPNIQRVCNQDLKFIGFLVRLLEWLHFMPHGRWRDMLWELEEVMFEELDYRFEATNIRRMKKNLRPHGIYVPQVFRRYTTPAVLVMEFIEGVLMSDYLRTANADGPRLETWREANNVEPFKVARRLVHSFFRQTLEENLFHGDLHPGNIVLLRDSRIAFLDFGSVGSMERDFTQKVDQYLQALGERQYAKMVDIFFLFSPSLPPADLEECKTEMIRRLEAWDFRNRVPDLPFSERSFNSIQDELVLFASTFGVAAVWTLFRMTRAMATMDASLRELVPRTSFHRLVNSYYRQRILRMREQLAVQLRDDPLNLTDWFELQDRLLDDMRLRGSIVRRAAQVFEETSSKIALFFAQMFSRTANLLLLIGLVLLVAGILQQSRPWLEPWWPAGLSEVLDFIPSLDLQVGILIGCALLYGYRHLVVLSRRFRQHDGSAG